MEKLTFEQLPEAVGLILEKLSRIELMLSGGTITDTHIKEMLTTTEAAQFMDVSLSLMYKLSHRNELPVYKPNGRKIYFKKEDLVNYMSRHRVKSNEEIEQEAINYVIKNPLNRF